MRQFLPGLLVGILFGAGFALSDMVNPARVLAFFDIAGSWDPSLALVMGGALLPAALAYAVARRIDRPLLETEFRIPESRQLNARLFAGATLFGIGWGLVGLCPGPAVAGLALGRWELWLFAAAMLAGMIFHKAAESPLFNSSSQAKGAGTMTDETKVTTRGQVNVNEIAELAARGFRMLINNRPDGEAPGQPLSDELQAEAQRHGMNYRHIPVVPGRAGDADARAFAEAIRQSDGPVVAFCRTGARAAALQKMTGQVD